MNGNNNSGTATTGSSIPSYAGTGSARGSLNPQRFQQVLTTLQQGVAGALPDGTSVLVAGGNVTKQSILDQLGALLATYQAVAETKVQLASKRKTLTQALPGGRTFARHLKDGLIASFGRGNAELTKFGIAVGKPARALTVQEKAARVARAQATRGLRHTLGRRQKAALQSPPMTVVVSATPANGNGSVTGSSVPNAKAS